MRRVLFGTLATFLFAVSLAPTAALAAGNPQTDPTCWTARACTGKEAAGSTATGEYRTNDNVGGTISTHWEEDDVCGADWGRCFPGEKVKLQVHLPTRGGVLKEVGNIGEYVGTVYTWAMRVAAILAVVVIMIGGMLWMTSGAAGTLQKGKDLIRNAVIGLLLVLGSYLILQTINPDLVKLTAPRLYMIRPVLLEVNFCTDLPTETTVYEKGTTSAKSDHSLLGCGFTFDTVAADGSLAQCLGRRCDPGNICVPVTTDTLRCKPGVFGGAIRTSMDEQPAVSIAEVCAERVGPARTAGSTAYRIIPADLAFVEPVEGGGAYRFIFTTPPTVSACDGGETNRMGFVLRVNGEYFGSDACGSNTPARITESNVRDHGASLFQADSFSGGGTESCEIRQPT